MSRDTGPAQQKGPGVSSGITQAQIGPEVPETGSDSHSSSDATETNSDKRSESQDLGDESGSGMSDGDSMDTVSSDRQELKLSIPGLPKHLTEESPTSHETHGQYSQPSPAETEFLMMSTAITISPSPPHSPDEEDMLPNDNRTPTRKRKGADDGDEPLSKKAKTSENAADQQGDETMTGIHPGNVGEELLTEPSADRRADAGSSKPAVEVVSAHSASPQTSVTPAFPKSYHDERVSEILLHPLVFNDLVHDLHPKRRVEPQPAFMSGALPQTDHTEIVMTEDDGYAVDAAVNSPEPVLLDYSSDEDADVDSDIELHAGDISADLRARHTAMEGAMHDIPLCVNEDAAGRTLNPQEAAGAEKNFADMTEEQRKEALSEKVARELQIQFDAEAIRDFEKEIRDASLSLMSAQTAFDGLCDAGVFKDLMKSEELDLLSITFKQALNPDLKALEDYNRAGRALRKLMGHWRHGRLDNLANISSLSRGFPILQEYLHQNNPSREGHTASTGHSNDSSPDRGAPDVLLIRRAQNPVADNPDPQPGSSAIDPDMEAALLASAKIDMSEALEVVNAEMKKHLKAILVCLEHVIDPEVYKGFVDSHTMKAGDSLLLDGINKGWLRRILTPECLIAVMRAFTKATELQLVNVQPRPEAIQPQRDEDVTMGDASSGPSQTVTGDMLSPPHDISAEDAEWDLNLMALAKDELQEAMASGKLKSGPGILEKAVDCLEKAGNHLLDRQLDGSAVSIALCYLKILASSGNFQEIVTPEYLQAAIRVLERSIQPGHTEGLPKPNACRNQPGTDGSVDDEPSRQTKDGPVIQEHADVRECVYIQTESTEPDSLDRRLVSNALEKFRQMDRSRTGNPLNQLLDGGSIDTAMAALAQALGETFKYDFDRRSVVSASGEFEAKQDTLERALDPVTVAIVVEALKRAKPTLDGNLSDLYDDLVDDDQQTQEDYPPDHGLALETFEILRTLLRRPSRGENPAMTPDALRATIAAVLHVYGTNYQLNVDLEVLGVCLDSWLAERHQNTRVPKDFYRHVDLIIDALRKSLQFRVEKAAALLYSLADSAPFRKHLEPRLLNAAVEALNHARYGGDFQIRAERGDLVKAVYAFERAEETGLLEALPERWIVHVVVMALKRTVNLLAWLSLPGRRRWRSRLPSRRYVALDLESGAWVPAPPLPYRLSDRRGTARDFERGMALVRSQRLLVTAGLRRYAPWHWRPDPDNIIWPIPCESKKKEVGHVQKKEAARQAKLDNILEEAREEAKQRMTKEQIAVGLGLAEGEQIPRHYHPPLAHRFPIPPPREDDGGDSCHGRHGTVHQAGGQPSETEQQTSGDASQRLAQARNQLAENGDAEPAQQSLVSSVDATWPEEETGTTPCDSEELSQVETQIAELTVGPPQQDQPDANPRSKTPTKFVLQGGRFMASPAPSPSQRDSTTAFSPGSSPVFTPLPSPVTSEVLTRVGSTEASKDSSHESSGGFFNRLRRESVPSPSPSPSQQPEEAGYERADTPTPPSPCEPASYDRADTPVPPSPCEPASYVRATTPEPSKPPVTVRLHKYWRAPGPSPLRTVTCSDDLPYPLRPTGKNGLKAGGGAKWSIRASNPRDSDDDMSPPSSGEESDSDDDDWDFDDWELDDYYMADREKDGSSNAMDVDEPVAEDGDDESCDLSLDEADTKPGYLDPSDDDEFFNWRDEPATTSSLCSPSPYSSYIPGLRVRRDLRGKKLRYRYPWERKEGERWESLEVVEGSDEKEEGMESKDMVEGRMDWQRTPRKELRTRIVRPPKKHWWAKPVRMVVEDEHGRAEMEWLARKKNKEEEAEGEKGKKEVEGGEKGGPLSLPGLRPAPQIPKEEKTLWERQREAFRKEAKATREAERIARWSGKGWGDEEISGEELNDLS